MEAMKKRSKKYFTIWCACFAIIDLLSRLYRQICVVSDDTHSFALLSIYQIVFFLIISLVLYPALFIVRHYAKLEESKIILVAVRFLLLAFSVWILAYLFLMVKEIVL